MSKRVDIHPRSGTPGICIYSIAVLASADTTQAIPHCGGITIPLQSI